MSSEISPGPSPKELSADLTAGANAELPGREKRPRLIFLVSHSSPGGVQELWANLANLFRSRGFQSSLVALYPPGSDALQPSDPEAWDYVAPQRPRSLRAKLRLFIKLRTLLRADGQTLVVTAMPAANVLAAVAARLSGHRATVVISHHTPAGTYNKVLNAIDGFVGCWKSVKFIVTVSDAVKDSLQGKPAAYRSKQKTIHNALPPDVEEYLSALRTNSDRSAATGRRVFATGRLAPQKNYAVLIRAAVRLPDVQFYFVGAGEDQKALEALASNLNVSGRVNFLGYHPRRDTLKMISEADIFAQPSLFEGHSLALIEAAKLGLPLVVSNIPVQIEGTKASDGTACAITADPEDDERFALEISRLLEDKDYYQKWAERSDKLAAGIAWEKLIDAYEDLFNSSQRS